MKKYFLFLLVAFLGFTCVLVHQLRHKTSLREPVVILNEHKQLPSTPLTPQQLIRDAQSTGHRKKNSFQTFTADISQGTIGYIDSLKVDQPFDNLFHIYLPQMPNSNHLAFLEYELYGLAHHTGVARSINDGQAIGGQFIQLSYKWSAQQEPLPTTLLRKGDNVIRFDIPEAADFYYKVRNVRITFRPYKDSSIIVMPPDTYFAVYGNEAYIKGMLNLSDKMSQPQLFCDGQPIEVWNGEFETVIKRPDTTSFVSAVRLTAVYPDGARDEKNISFTRPLTAYQKFELPGKGLINARQLRTEKDFSLSLALPTAASGIHIPSGSLPHNKTISITALRDVDLPALNSDIVNVTKGSPGFRFLPHGSQFKNEATLSLPFDSTLIPEGYTAADIRTYFFNEINRTWEALPVDTILADEGIVKARTTHFTDMINGIIKVPESPQTQGYTPTTIKDMKAADPSAGIPLINPPSPSSNGGASLDFPLKLPPGRNGLQPSLAIQYNNQGGNSWTGLGWSLSTPSVSIETRWGAPRYDASLETETYTLNGQQLAPVAHRGVLKPRTPDKQFTARVEGAFNRITRHGNHPSNYWWEVTGKDGVRNCYGGMLSTGVINNAVLKDENGNIGYWALVETRDADDNYVSYEYEQVNEVGISGGSVMGKQLYLKHVAYTGHRSTPGAYKVSFIRDRELGEAKRKDIDISGSLGFKMVSTDLLRKVEVSFKNQLIRSYELSYKEGAFYKTLLNTISELDATGAVFYSHNFHYYDDVVSQQGYQPLGPLEDWSPGSDNIKGDILNPIPGFTGEGSALSTSKSSNISGGLTVSVGSGYGGFWSKLLSVGGTFSYSQDNSEGLVSIIDINGDGLPDKVFKKNGSLSYRPNLGKGPQPFGNLRPINGINDFSLTKSKTTSWGVQVVPLIAFYGNNNSNTTATTSVYFSDFNGDGLIDIVSNGKVYFNRLNSNGDPDFTQNSGLTPSPVVTASSVDKILLIPDQTLQAEQERQFPLHDIIKVWEAPFTGTVKITAPLRLLPPLVQSGIQNPKKDGVRASIQVRDNEIWQMQIGPSDHSTKQPAGVSNINVTKGDRIYFRLASIYNGEDDWIEWEPEIEYLTPVSPFVDANNQLSSKYKSSSDFILDNKSFTRLGKNGLIRIDGRFKKGITSDSVVLLIVKEKAGNETVVHKETFRAREIVDKSIMLNQIVADSGSNLRFILRSDTYIDRSKLEWAPHFQYTAFNDNTPVLNSLNEPTIEAFVVPDNMNYNDWRIATPVMTAAMQDTVKILPYFSISPNQDTTTIVFSIKGVDTLYHKQKLSVVGGILSTAVDTIEVIRKPGEPLYLEYTTEKRNLALALGVPKVIVLKDSTYFDYNLNQDVTLTLRDTLGCGLYTNPAQDYFGPMFRGWGQFAFKGSKPVVPLDQSKLNLNEFSNFPTNPDDYDDPSEFNTLGDPSKTNFIALFAHGKKGVWMGYDTAVYVGRNLLSSSRLWMHDVSVDTFMNGETVGAVNKISTTRTRSQSLGISFVISATQGVTNSTTTTNLDMMDMNGDRYPDVMNENTIQYTLPNGGLEQKGKSHGLGTSVNQSESKGFSLGGGFPVAYSGKKTGDAAASEQKQASVSIGLSGNTGNGTDETISTWNDMNGDGLPDKIYKDGRVALNLGYKFTPAENWGVGDIDKNTNNSQGAGLGVTIDAASFQAGFGLSRGNGYSSTSFQDINGDGLPDKITLANNRVIARLNLGNGFGPAIPWNNLTAISKNVNTGESINAAFTIVIPIPIPFFPLKICINPSFSTGHGVSRRLDQIMDVDGDGYPDLLHSENDGHLVVSRSQIGRTNMLQKVERPLGGAFVLDYQRVGNTYELAQSKWVLKSVEVQDGLPGDGADVSRTRFTYEDGFYNRHEREFYGFQKVTTEQLNTAANNVVYRKKIQKYLNSTYYVKGLLESEWTEDGAGNKFTQTENLYQLRKVQDSSYYPALIQTTKLFYEGRPFIGTSTAMQFDYDALGNVIKIIDEGDGTPQDRITADVTYHDLNGPYIKSIPSSISVTTSEGIKRRRTTTIDNTGNITRIQQFLTNSQSANTDMEYDQYGNLSKIIRPANYKGERMWYQYEYDPEVHSFVIKVSDAFGYSSTSTYDYRFGETTGTVSMQGQEIGYQFDNRGRLTIIRGPYEIIAGKPYTIRHEYHPEAAVPYAVTSHYDPEHNGDIKTITFMDGLARPVQVKKQAAIFKGKGLEDDLRMIISGRVFYDAFGRAVTTHYPTTEAMGSNNTALSNTLGTVASTTTYDVQDRQVRNVLADGATTQMVYSISNRLFNTKTIDALNNSKESLADVRGRNRITRVFGGPNGTITTTFVYNALSELLQVTDTKGNTTSYTYDDLGRKLSVRHPDAGLTEFSYDLAGNLLQKVSAQIRKEIPNGGAIKYGYEYERLTDIDYPRYYQNKVKYVYGAPGKGNRTGRLILTMDASGGQEFFYGPLGETIKTIRTVLISPIYSVTYVSEQEYDTWNRVKRMVYPDGEEVVYHYNKGGSLRSFEGKKMGHTYKYVNQVGYDEYEQRVYLQYGNGTETAYQYDPLRRRLVNLKALTAKGHEMMNNKYTYDAVSNILGVENDITGDSLKMGGYARYDYDYDNLYRLVKAKGVYRGSNTPHAYSLDISYDDLYNITRKKMVDSVPSKNYEYNYKYQSSAPHQLAAIGDTKYSYDANGNMLGTIISENFWDEENRLIAVLNSGIISRYTYDASGDRVIKSSGGLQGIWVNGAPAGTIKHYDNYTAYVSPYLVTRRTGFTKHFFIETQRVVSKLGNGSFTNISFPLPVLTAGGVDYSKRAEEMEKAMISHYASLGVSPGPPTDKNFWARPENNGIAPPVYVDNSYTNAPPGWPTGPTHWIGQPITLNGIPSRDSVKAGFGFDGTGHVYEQNQYFYHPDHLGSTSYVTDVLGEVNQHVEYSAFGETFFEEHATSTTMPYLFNAKEKDAETGYYYYGARYYDAKLSLWLSVDPMEKEYPGLSPYNFCLNNPIINIDTNGKWVITIGNNIKGTAGASIGGGVGFAFGTSKDGGFNFGTYSKNAVGASINPGVSGEITFGVSQGNIEDLGGKSSEVNFGAETPIVNVGAGVSLGKDENGNMSLEVSVGVGIGGPIPVDFGVSESNTSVNVNKPYTPPPPSTIKLPPTKFDASKLIDPNAGKPQIKPRKPTESNE